MNLFFYVNARSYIDILLLIIQHMYEGGGEDIVSLIGRQTVPLSR